MWHMEPIAGAPSGGAPLLPPATIATLLEQLQGEGTPNLAIEEGATLPGDERLEIELSDEHRTQLARDLKEILASYDTAMPERHRRWKHIKDAYNLVPDAARQGLRPDASRLVSEMTRSQVNTASARLEESLFGVRPFMKFDVWYDDAPDEETKQLVAAARAAEVFFENYADTDLQVPRWGPAAVHRCCKLGSAIAYVKWKKEKRSRRFRTARGDFDKAEQEYGRIDVTLVPNENVIVWPLHETEIDRLDVVGHRTFYTPAQFRAWAPEIGLGAERVQEIVDASMGDDVGPLARDEDLLGKDIRTAGLNPFKGQVEITELWCRLALPGQTEPTDFQVHLHEKSGLEKAVLRVGKQPYHCATRPYFDFQYWIEDGSFWGSGAGHELLFPQAADSSLMNLLIDNLKIIANYVRLVKAGSSAEALQDQIGPGMNIVTENPKEDVVFEQLGGDLEHIYKAMDRNDMRAMKATGVTAPLQGMGDPVLKSGASPSSLQMLINEANQKFGKVDKNLRRTLSRIFAFFFELIQQYAPEGLFYHVAPEEQAGLLQRLKYTAPAGELSRMFRIRVEAPSATSNREVQKQNIMVVYQLTAKHIETLLALGQQVIAQRDPEGFEQFRRQTLVLLNEFYAQIVNLHDLPGLGSVLPKIPEPTPEHEVIAQLQQQLQQLQQQLQQLQQQLVQAQQQMQQQMQGGIPSGPPGQPMGPPGQQPGLPGAVPAPAG